MAESVLLRFLKRPNTRPSTKLPALSLFSGAGLSDLGYELAGFGFAAQCELDKHRAEICKCNFPNSECVVGDVREKWSEVLQAYRNKTHSQRPALLSLTPPCQGMSSSNPGRGKITNPDDGVRDERNLLLLSALPIVHELKPRIIVAENVAPLLNRIVKVGAKNEIKTVVEAFEQGLEGYHLFIGIVQMADYGIPQVRRRSILVAVSEDEPCLEWLKTKKLLPWPRPTHAECATLECEKWVTVREWFEMMRYPPLDAQDKPNDPEEPLHFVPRYTGDRYLMIAEIPPNSGQNAYQNPTCPDCHKNGIPLGLAYCPHCGNLLRNRPYFKPARGKARLIKGFESSYRRMYPDRPASTVTTNSSHVGSDYKIHPWENRVLSVRECADLQTVPRFFDWSWALDTHHSYVIRNAVGEALPTYFAYLHGQVLKELLNGRRPESKLSRAGIDGQERIVGKTDSENASDEEV
jgi:DNA (cytosine-5)-methyltransferase 1